MTPEKAATVEAKTAAPENGRTTIPALKKTTKRTITKRGVLWLGQTCNARCYFCYFLNRIEDARHPEHPFMTLEKAKEICHTLRYVYGNTAIDIQGGEPTIHPDILELIRYCDEIGLYPTLITNGIALAKPGVLEKFQAAGVRDFLVSLHGIGEIHDEVVVKKGAYNKIIKSIERMRELGIPFRYNCTMSKPVVPLLPEIARKAVEYGARAVNFLAFNPFEDQATGQRTTENVPRYTEIKPYLTEAMDILDEHSIECNVRYLPLCMAEERHRKNFYNFQQLPYDHHEWDYQSWVWTGLQPERMKEGPLVPAFKLGPLDRRIMGVYQRVMDLYHKHPIAGRFGLKVQHGLAAVEQALSGKEKVWRKEAMIRAEYDAQYQYHPACEQCSLRNICDGFHGDYAAMFGAAEAEPVTGIPKVVDPLHYIREQEKVVEVEDESWAL